MKKFIPYIIIAWSLLVFVGYNVLTVEAAEEKDMVDALREMKFVNDDEDDTGLKSIAIEQACKDNDGQWKDNSWCKFDKDKTGDEVEFEHQLEDRGLMYLYQDKESGTDEWDKYQAEKHEKSQKGEQEYEKYVAKQEEKAAQEDAICDNEDADTTNIKLCMSEEREHHYTDVQIEKGVCKDEGFEWKQNGGCDTKGDEKKWDEVYYKVGQALAEREIEEDKEKQEETVKEIVKNLEGSEPWTNYPIEQKPIEEIEDWSNTVSETNKDEEEALKQLKEPREADENQVQGNAELEYTETESSDNEETQEAEESIEADEQVEEEQDEPEEEDDNNDSESEE